MNTATRENCTLDTANPLTIENVDVFYNPVEKLVIVKPSLLSSAATMRWAKNNCMRRCSTCSLSSAIFYNMGWEQNFKYRILASVYPIDGEPALVFSLTDAVPDVPAKAGAIQNIDTQNMSEDDAKQMMKKGLFPEEGVVPDLDDFDLGNGPIASTAKTMARSRAIYYDENTEKTAGELHVADLGDKKYDPAVIQSLVQRGLTPKEGWYYLKGIAVIRKSSFSIYPESWIGNIGDSYYESTGLKMRERFGNSGKIEEGIDYGWTVGLKLPKQADIDAEVNALMAEASV